MAFTLKQISQRLAIREKFLTTAVRQEMVPGIPSGQGMFDEQQTVEVAIAAVLLSHGLEGPAVREFVSRTRSQLRDGRDVLQVDYRGEYPVTLRIEVADLLARLQ